MFIRIKLIATFQVGLQISNIESSRNPAAENLRLLDEVGQEVTGCISRWNRKISSRFQKFWNLLCQKIFYVVILPNYLILSVGLNSLPIMMAT